MSGDRRCERGSEYAHLVVVKGDTEDIGQEEHDFRLVVLAGRSRDVRLEAADRLDLAYRKMVGLRNPQSRSW